MPFSRIKLDQYPNLLEVYIDTEMKAVELVSEFEIIDSEYTKAANILDLKKKLTE